MQRDCIATDSHMPRPLCTWGCIDTPSHDHASHVILARRAAAFLGYSYDGRLEAYEGPGQPFYIPRDTLHCQDGPDGLRDQPPRETDFWGGWVPAPLLASKAIVHPVAEGDVPPPAWRAGFAAAAAGLTLPGATAFSCHAAAQAGRALLRHGSIKLKPAQARGGIGQSTVHSQAALDRALDRLQAGDVLAGGLVLERNLRKSRTYSVGQVRLGEWVASYVGQQFRTRDNAGRSVYAGSKLRVIRGGFARLMDSLAQEAAAAARLALAFDRLADEHLGLVASRRNYDVIAGVDDDNVPRMAVLEQSWRVGGASSAELAALELFAKHPQCQSVTAEAVERYGAAAVPPKGAVLYFQGNDPDAGPLVKYSLARIDG